MVANAFVPKMWPPTGSPGEAPAQLSSTQIVAPARLSNAAGTLLLSPRPGPGRDEIAFSRSTTGAVLGGSFPSAFKLGNLMPSCPAEAAGAASAAALPKASASSNAVAMTRLMLFPPDSVRALGSAITK